MQVTGTDPAWLGYERMVPSVLLPPEDPSGPRPRTMRDWAVDLGVMAVSAVIGVVGLLASDDPAIEGLSTTWIVLDLVAGTLAVLSLFVRRRRPVTVGLFTAALSTFSISAGMASAAALFTVAVHRRLSRILPVLAANLAALEVSWLLRPTPQSWLELTAITVAVTAIVVGFGMFVRARRQLVWTLEERARRAEEEQDLRAEHARAAERARIAREMHDVLGHRISLLALHAGGLELRPNLPPAEVAETAGLLRSTARQALDDLRAVIGVLRDDGTVDVPTAPQPTLADLGRLVDDSRGAGATVQLSLLVADVTATPPAAGRVAYRVVQEALTNVAKHAPGAATFVTVSGGPDEGLALTVRNGTAHRPTPDRSLPGAGVGLIGLRERVELAGGTLTHGIDDRGEFVVEARLRWE